MLITWSSDFFNLNFQSRYSGRIPDLFHTGKLVALLHEASSEASLAISADQKISVCIFKKVICVALLLRCGLICDNRTRPLSKIASSRNAKRMTMWTTRLVFQILFTHFLYLPKNFPFKMNFSSTGFDLSLSQGLEPNLNNGLDFDPNTIDFNDPLLLGAFDFMDGVNTGSSIFIVSATSNYFSLSIRCFQRVHIYYANSVSALCEQLEFDFGFWKRAFFLWCYLCW